MNTQQLLIGAMLTCATLCTTSCRSTLYNAASDGDVQTVKAELADGADPSGKASAANLLWQIPTGIITIPVDLVRLFLPGTPGWYETGEKTESGTPEMKFDWKTLLTRKVYNYRKATAMDVATDKNHAEVVTELILAGSEASGWAKSLALAAAARKGDADTLRRLMEKGCAEKADWNNKGDYKPLMLAIGGGHEECARILLENGAKFESTATINKQVITSYDYAVSKGQLELYKKLGGTIIAAPVSIAGKKIVFDYRQAEYRDTDDSLPEGQWREWKECGFKTVETPTFGKNNKYIKKMISPFNDSLGYIDDQWVYKKTGTKTAEISGFEDELEYGGEGESFDYKLIFDSPTSGTAESEEGTGMGGEMSQYRNIRFTIK